mmetsp:Transcript_38339/g.43926  ORF Transcript_38339/g.43926 Transcript_38339/m.43926 type:complete len:168 (-) Transcript_38339:543-1046(-)
MFKEADRAKKVNRAVEINNFAKQKYYESLEHKRKSVLEKHKKMLMDKEKEDFKEYLAKTAEVQKRLQKYKENQTKPTTSASNKRRLLKTSSCDMISLNDETIEGYYNCKKLARVYSPTKSISCSQNFTPSQSTTNFRTKTLEILEKQKEEETLLKYLEKVDNIMNHK